MFLFKAEVIDKFNKVVSASIHIIPMLNPDGVVLGNYRTCITGKDLNRCYFDPDEQLFPTIFSLKKLLREQKNV